MTFTRRSLGQRDAVPVPTLSRIAPTQPPLQSGVVPETPLRELAPPEEWSAESPEGLVQTRSLHSIAWRLNSNADSGFYERLRPIPTGFEALDQWIGNGIRPGELALLGGAQGVGKTTFCLQMARNIAA